MEIIFIRHTTPNIEKGICYGQTNLDVASTFSNEVKNILEKEDFYNLDAVFYSSPLLRCKKLANKIAKNVIFDDRLKELNFGDWELQNWNDINKEDLNVWMQDFVNVSTPNGESYIDLQKRTVSFLLGIKEKNHQKIVIITHAGVIRSLHAFIHNIPLKKSFDLKLNYGDVLKINDP
ncbi:alpha-ribazole phosphatase [Polaribacter batillariae]|uniref:Alpha-ribazole phosphatase n=1 Tax=Polaribacter batillariae TaxID=2808900 RepID=A0ABX7SYD5_9FLAO|nr:alpha-ribazole phosphatase [Polaribacter batillariae]QTD37843.1 alpha-ribazole phosphatase [Polaribacter batillariae]